MDRFPLHAATNQQGSGDTKSSVLDKHLEGESWGSRFLLWQSWRCRPVWFIAKGAPSQNSSTCWVAFSEVLGCGAAAARNKSEQMAQQKSSESARFSGNHIKLLDTRLERSHFLRSRHPNSFCGSPEGAIRYDSLLGFPLPMFINFAVAFPEVLGCGAAAAHSLRIWPKRVITE